MQAQIAGIKAQRALARLSTSLRRSSPGAGMPDPRISGPRICETDMPATRAADPVVEAARALLLSDDVLKHWRTQPRVPAGSPQGGQWTTDGGGGGAQIQQVGRGRNQPPNQRPNQRQRYEPFPRTGFIMHRGERIDVNVKEYVAYNSSARRANMLTELARRYDPNWRPNPSISQGLPGAIRDQQYRGDQALQRLQELRLVFLREQNINNILYPSGKPIGSVYRTRDPNIRTVGRGQFKQLLAQLTHGARRIDGQLGRGEVYLRPDGVTVNVRYSRGSNGLTLDIGWPGGPGGKIHKVHFQSHINWKGFNLMQKAQFFPEYSDVQHALIRYHAVQNIEFGNMTKMIYNNSMNFREYMRMKLGDWEGGFPNDVHHLTRDLDSAFRFEGEELVQAKLYLLTVLIGHGMVPMTYNYADFELEYAPEYAYGETPQEIIDNLHADWCARELDTPQMEPLMLGWESECGGFYSDSPELSGVNDD